MDVKEHIEQLKDALALEKASDLKQYEDRTKLTSHKHRRKTGVCWYPVILEKSSYDNGERLMIRVSRSKEHIQSDAFQSGKLVQLFCTTKNGGEVDHQVQGVVNQVREQEMIITLNCDDVPRWVHDGLLGVQLLFDESSYREMEYALKKIDEAEEPRLKYLLEVLYGNVEAKQHIDDKKFDALNASQNEAIALVKGAEDVAIIHGPPGTGKTTTMVAAIQQVLKKEAQVLVCAPSNAAVDLLVEKLVAQELSVLRIGNPARVNDTVLTHTLDYQVSHHRDYKNYRALKKQAEEYFSMGGKWKRNFGRDEREQRKLLLAEARKIKQEAESLNQYMASDIVEKVQVICTTLVGAANMKLKGKHFETLFIDEAGQCIEPACWIPILKTNRVVFAGDHQQLPPTVKTVNVQNTLLHTSLFERSMLGQTFSSVLLKEQYRMNELIMGYSNEQFYGGQLFANQRVAHWTLFEGDAAFEFVDTAGAGFSEEVDRESRSTLNKEEAAALLKHLKSYLNELNEQEVILNGIGIIAPYKAQVRYIEELVDADSFFKTYRNQLKISTVDSFQGQERDIIYLSLTRSNDKGEIGFLADKRRMNVAMTRARKKLVVLADSATICRNEFYEALFNYANEKESYRSVFEWLYD